MKFLIHYVLVKLFILNVLFNCIGMNKTRQTNNGRFKEQFGSNNDMLISDFLSIFVIGHHASFAGTYKEIRSLEPVNDFSIARYSEIDVLYKHTNGTEFIIQTSLVPEDEKFEDYISLIRYYAVNAYIKRFPSLEKVVFIAFLKYIMFPDKPYYKSIDVVFDKKYNYYNNNAIDENNLKKFSLIIIELPKFVVNNISKVINVEERWLYLFKYGNLQLSEDDLKKLSLDVCFESLPLVKELNSMDPSSPLVKVCKRIIANTYADVAMLPPDERRKAMNESKTIMMMFAKNMLKENLPVDLFRKEFNFSDNDITKLRKAVKADNSTI